MTKGKNVGTQIAPNYHHFIITSKRPHTCAVFTLRAVDGILASGGHDRSSSDLVSQTRLAGAVHAGEHHRSTPGFAERLAADAAAHRIVVARRHRSHGYELRSFSVNFLKLNANRAFSLYLSPPTVYF